MRININLASNPYEAAREYTRRMGLLVGALAIVTVGLLGFILYQRAHTRDIDRKITATQQEISSLDAEKAQAQAILNRPANRDIAGQSQFLNELFARKALSWTRVFSEMEKLMPANIHVVSMKPEFDRDNQLVLHVVVVTSARDKAVELVRQMEKSPHFRSPQVEAENTTGNEGNLSNPAGNIQFEIAAVYIPYAGDSESESSDDQQDKTKAPEAKAPEKTGVNPIVPSKTTSAQKPVAVAGGVR